MFKKLKNNESGMILMIVLLIVAVMMIFTITILTQSISQTTASQKEIERIKAEQLAKGIFWNAYAGGSGQQLTTGPVTIGAIDGKTYQATITSLGAGPANTTAYSINVSY